MNTIVTNTKKRILHEYRRLLLPGVPMISSRISQLYDNGVCIYFYLCISCFGNNVEYGSEICSKLISTVVREIITKTGGSLSHHHGIGKIRAPLLLSNSTSTSIGETDQNYCDDKEKIKSSSQLMSEIMSNIKNTIDPQNVFGVRNGIYVE